MYVASHMFALVEYLSIIGLLESGEFEYPDGKRTGCSTQGNARMKRYKLYSRADHSS